MKIIGIEGDKDKIEVEGESKIQLIAKAPNVAETQGIQGWANVQTVKSKFIEDGNSQGDSIVTIKADTKSKQRVKSKVVF